jgi:hypothetical protein
MPQHKQRANSSVFKVVPGLDMSDALNACGGNQLKNAEQQSKKNQPAFLPAGFYKAGNSAGFR